MCGCSLLCEISLLSWTMACGYDASIGPFCDKASITESTIADCCLPKFNDGPTNGIVFELNSYQKKHNNG